MPTLKTSSCDGMWCELCEFRERCQNKTTEGDKERK
jgi:hypothetical protein